MISGFPHDPMLPAGQTEREPGHLLLILPYLPQREKLFILSKSMFYALYKTPIAFFLQNIIQASDKSLAPLGKFV